MGAVLATVPSITRAQTYPVRPVRIIVGYAAGGSNDIVARLMGQWLSERLGQPFVIENRRNALREAQFRVSPRHCAGREYDPPAPRHSGKSIGSG
jgi:hypothetical protein